MSCNIRKNNKGEYIVRADNGKPSILYKHLKATLGNERLSLEKWASTKTPQFNSYFPDGSMYLDDNGEPSMLYVLPEQDYLYYAKKDQSSSAAAKDKITRQNDLKAIEAQIEEQTTILKASFLRDLNQFKAAEAAGSRTNRYIDVANSLARTLYNNADSVEAITKFVSSASYYLREAKSKLASLKDSTDTNARLEVLNELGQLLIVFNNLQEYSRLTGKYEKSLFQVQMEGFFDEYGLVVNKETYGIIQGYKSSNEGLISKIRKDIVKQVDKLKNITDKEKDFIIKEFDDLVENKENLSSIYDDFLNERDELESRLRNDYYTTVTDWLFPFVEENQVKVSEDLRITKKQFKNYLQKAQQDAGIGEYTLASLSTINDPIAQAIRLAAEQARQDGHRETVDDQASLSRAKSQQYANTKFEEGQYDKYLKTVTREVKSTDEEGNVEYKTVSTKALVTPYLTENLERDRNQEFKRQVEYHGKVEDDKIAKLESKIATPGLTDLQRTEALNAFEKAKEDKDYNVRKAVSKSMNAWYETKYDIAPNKSEIIKRRMKELSPDDFKAWYANNIYRTTVSADSLEYHKKNRKKFVMLHPDNINDINGETKGSSFYKPGRLDSKGNPVEYYVYEIKYGHDFTTPKEEYADPKYASLTNDKFFNELTRVYHKSNDVLSEKHKLKHGIIPQIEKGSKPFWDASNTAGENVRKMWNNMSPDIYADNHDQEIEQDGILMKMSKTTQNVDGTQIKTIPVKFVSLLDDGANLDTNLIETFVKFSAVTNRYKQMEKTNASARAIKNLIVGNPSLGIKAREIALTDASGNPVISSLSNLKDKVINLAVKDKGIKLNQLLVDFIDDAWYGEIETKENINILGKDISLNKLSNFTSKWVSIQRLAGNLDSAISNLVIGKLAIFNESLAGRFYTKSEYFKASKIINKDLFDGSNSTIIKDYMEEDINKKSLYAQLMIRHDAIQGEFSNEYGIKIGKKTALEMGKDFLFFSQNGMEYSIQKRSMLCVSMGFKVELPQGMMYDPVKDELRAATPEEITALAS